MRLSPYIGAFQLIIAVIAFVVTIYLTVEEGFDAVAGMYLLITFLATFQGVENFSR